MLALVSKRSYGHYIVVVIPLLIPYLASIFNLMKNVTISKVLFLSLGLSVVYLSNINAVKESIRTRDRNSSYLQQTVANYIKSNTEFNDRIYSPILTMGINPIIKFSIRFYIIRNSLLQI